MIAVARCVGRFDGRSRFSTWVYRVATNACLDELRRRSRRALPVDDLPDGDAPFVAGGPAGDVDDADLRLDVQDALLRLPLEFRAAVVLRDLCGLDYEEISTTLDIPVGTVRSRIARGRGALARILGGNRDEPADLRLDVQDALLRLPLEFRAAVVLRDLCGLDYEEISTTLDIPVGTVRSRIARGRGALARILGGNRDEPADRPTSQS